MKKQWKRPELVVLGRSRSEENVLAFCKTGGNPSGGPSGSHQYCTTDVDTTCGSEAAGCYKCCDAPST